MKKKSEIYQLRLLRNTRPFSKNRTKKTKKAKTKTKKQVETNYSYF